MSVVKAEDVKRGIAVIWENLQCPICLDLMSEPVSTQCDHQFCKFCMTKLLERNKRKETSCPVCKTKVTKRSLKESPGFQKLVEGLRNLVCSYEIDTRTNYFTGLPKRRHGASVETESRDQQGSGENTTSEGTVTEKEATISSTAAAKDAFAKLMCLEDSCPATLVKDRSDSSLADLPQKSETNLAVPEDVLPRAEASDSPTQQDVAPYEVKHSCRRSKRLCLDPDRIMDKREKKSVQKVSEWLLKISPVSDAQAEHSAEGDFPKFTDSDAEKESTASGVSTEINNSAHGKADASPIREVLCRGLEEQVFGAVYKRERKVIKSKVAKSFSPVQEIAPVVRYGNLSEKAEKVEIPQRRSSRRLNSADFIRKTSNKDTEDGLDQEEVDEGSNQENGNTPLRSSGKQERVQSGPDKNAELTEDSPAFAVPLRKRGRRSKMQDVWKDVDCELTENESNTNNKKDRKRRITRSTHDTTKDDNLERCKNAKYAKSLALVSAGAEIVELSKVPSNLNLIETEVNIESYPSSAEMKSPDARKTRRSLRLQEFTAEVQGLPRRRRSKQAHPKPADGPENNPSANLDEPSAKTAHLGTSHINDSQSEKTEWSMRRNGCVYNDNFENIEIMQSSDDVAALSIAEENSHFSVVPDSVDHILPCSTKAANMSSPLAALVPESLPQKYQESPSTKTLKLAVEHKVTEQDDDTNDSELDTEQLMKTFKATKRKSFDLGSPRTSHSRTQEKSLTQILEEEKQENVDLTETPGISLNIDQVLPPNPSEVSAHEIMSQNSQSGIADVASVSLLQVKSTTLPKDTQKHNSISTSGASDKPEMVANSQDYSRSQDSRPSVKVDLANSVQLFSTSPTQKETQISHNKESTKSPNSSEIQGCKVTSIPLGPMTSSETQCNNFESSVTPDGLVPNGPEVQLIEPETNHNLDKLDEGEFNSQPCLRRKRKPQRLESSDSESSVEDDDLPPLAQIFKSPHLSSSSAKEPVKNSLNQNRLQVEEQNTMAGLVPASQDSRSHSEPEGRSNSSSQCVAPYQKQKSLQDVNSNDVRDGGISDPACMDEWITSSQGSVDLFGTPQESEDVAGGAEDVAGGAEDVAGGAEDVAGGAEDVAGGAEDVAGGAEDVAGGAEDVAGGAEDVAGGAEDVAGGAEDVAGGKTGHSIESSQCTSEIITTQQRDEMQQELHRLERMMALVTEALQKKGGDLDNTNKTEDVNQHPGINTGPRRSQRSCKRGRQLSQRSEVKGQRAAAEDSTVDVMDEKKPNELKGETLRCKTGSGGRTELVASGLSAAEQGLLKKFARKMKAGVSSHVTPTTTHIIIKTDGDLVCERTLKYFQGIAGRKWVVSFLWISECFKHGKLLSEDPYEVCGDVVNGRDHKGPQKARIAPENNLLMKGCEICFQGSFTDMTTDQMEVMVELCGATVVKDPLMFSRKNICYQLVVVQPDPDDSQSYYAALQRKATVVTRSWLLDSVATYTLQNPRDYKP
ncbi:breast cancer type 1 susceptibility protein homolog isoform X1 [Tachysurus vachellii]|uniref:breast cancer type 1 susceptibility protein homolog isoform X1 n=1 Tax=Tachysurus vachellii TaxID=175792 RepID=UPI00296AC837|nr:breast cancer type 1 susceptibility protein homolog isoform X1 [Tachysurus vachellii]XP_060718411.1 breast cancer type 1 susceptibility protein homolog isoform X1 [Tachysurus vachellii]